MEYFSKHTIYIFLTTGLKMKKNITFKQVNTNHPLLGSIISGSIGFPTVKKVDRVLQSYTQPNQFLIGDFASDNLIAIIGFELTGKQAIIKNISVSNDFKRQGIGNCLIQKTIKNYALNCVSLKTDDESVNFYKKVGFKCTPFDDKHGNRYYCHLEIPLPEASSIQQINML